MLSSFNGVSVDAGQYAPGPRRRLRQAWQALHGPPRFDAVIRVDAATESTVVTVADGGRIDITGSVVLGAGSSIQARPGGGFVIKMPGGAG